MDHLTLCVLLNGVQPHVDPFITWPVSCSTDAHYWKQRKPVFKSGMGQFTKRNKTSNTAIHTDSTNELVYLTLRWVIRECRVTYFINMHNQNISRYQTLWCGSYNIDNTQYGHIMHLETGIENGVCWTRDITAKQSYLLINTDNTDEQGPIGRSYKLYDSFIGPMN